MGAPPSILTAVPAITSAAYIAAWRDAPSVVLDPLAPLLGSQLADTESGPSFIPFGDGDDRVEVLMEGHYRTWSLLSRSMGEAAIAIQAPYLLMARARFRRDDEYQMMARADVNAFRWVVGALDRSFRAFCEAVDDGSSNARKRAQWALGLAARLFAHFVKFRVDFAQDVGPNPVDQLMFFIAVEDERERLGIPSQRVQFHGLTFREQALAEGAATLLVMDFPPLDRVG